MAPDDKAGCKTFSYVRGSTPRERGDGFPHEREISHFAALPQFQILSFAGIRQYQDFFSAGIFEGDVFNAGDSASGIDARRSTPDTAGKMGESPILSASCDFFCLGVDRNQPAAREWTDIRASFLVKGEIPSGD